MAGKIAQAAGGFKDKPAHDGSRVRVRMRKRMRRTWWRSTFRELTGSLETEE